MFDALLLVLLLLGPLIWLIPCFFAFLVTLIFSLSMAPSARRLKVRLLSALLGIALLAVLFWDLPVLWEYEKLCENDAGFIQYQTIEGWKAENPGIAETLVSIENAKFKNDGSYTHVPLNQRFEWVFSNWDVGRGIRKREDRIVDVQSGAILARYVDFSSGMKNTGISPFNVRLYKVWLTSESCPRDGNKDRWLINGDSFRGFKNTLKKINGVIE
ncbi:hypothetical protein QWY82_09845 [Simiduia curdlanivorans]|uniref:Uncharacterized protein n=1 Tax=Simiduia curdlanivorans TaxID=1492769 RepID=A0ABV8V948_9GAMM|nr:hypothetical protein [Simiduia curdlanivorans]MDN3639110.1 hypothetical protein [Simiduia curdlanivorans]